MNKEKEKLKNLLFDFGCAIVRNFESGSMGPREMRNAPKRLAKIRKQLNEFLGLTGEGEI